MKITPERLAWTLIQAIDKARLSQGQTIEILNIFMKTLSKDDKKEFREKFMDLYLIQFPQSPVARQ